MFPAYIWIKILLLIAIGGGLSWWVIREESRLADLLNHHHERDNLHTRLFKLIKWRSYAALAIFMTLTTLSIFFDWRWASDHKAALRLAVYTSKPHTTQSSQSREPLMFKSLPTIEDGAINAAALYAENTDDMAQFDQIKRRYEELVVSYYYLQQCGASDTTLLQRIKSSFLATALPSDIDALSLWNATESAAKGTYEVLFSSSACDDAQITRLVAVMRAL